MAVAAFDYAAWSARYPEFAGVAEATAVMYFAEAGLYCDNTDSSPVVDATMRGVFLNMLTAHIAALAAAEIVGRVSSASEGSVSVQTDFAVPGSSAWYSQTKYGAAYWAATGRYRRLFVVPAPGYGYGRCR